MLLKFAKAAFDAEAIKRAAYVLMNRAAVAVDADDTHWLCTITPLDMKGPSAEDLGKLLHREVLDQDLRLSIEAKTEATRTAILGLAFSRTGLQGE